MLKKNDKMKSNVILTLHTPVHIHYVTITKHYTILINLFIILTIYTHCDHKNKDKKTSKYAKLIK